MRHPVACVITAAAALAASALQAAGGSSPSPAVTPIATPSAKTADPQTIASPYWGRTQEGWFWYRVPPAPPNPEEAAAPAPPRPETTAPAPQRARPPELDTFDAMQARLEELKRVAVINPSDANMTAYMRYQRQVMDTAERFAQRWQRLVWSEPDLDYALSGRPTQALAVAAFDAQRQSEQEQAVRSLAASHGLIFVFRGDCPFCHRFAPILKRFAQTHGLTVLPISLDGGTLPEFPDARPDNGMAARLNARAVPALYLTQPRLREIRTVGFGLMSEADLLDRLSSLGRETSGGIPGAGGVNRSADPFTGSFDRRLAGPITTSLATSRLSTPP
jgi:conjugal transfer pilus assembly protein TraF